MSDNKQLDDRVDEILFLAQPRAANIISPPVLSKEEARKQIMALVETECRKARQGQHEKTAGMFVYENASITYARLKRERDQLNSTSTPSEEADK